jgi:hypothetical protein
MAFTYDDSLPTDKDKVRFLVGDTNEATAALSNKEVEYCVTLGGSNLLRACAWACDSIANKLARNATTRVRGQETEIQNAYAAYRKLAQDFRDKAKGSSSFFALLTKTDLEIWREDSDLIPPTFYMGMHDTFPSSREP